MPDIQFRIIRFILKCIFKIKWTKEEQP
jgi:hypothetical protein